MNANTKRKVVKLADFLIGSDEEFQALLEAVDSNRGRSKAETSRELKASFDKQGILESPPAKLVGIYLSYKFLDAVWPDFQVKGVHDAISRAFDFL